MARYIDDTGIEVDAAEWPGDDFDTLLARSVAAKILPGEGGAAVVGGRSTDADDEMTGRRVTFQPGDWLVVHPVTGGWDCVDAATFAARYEETEG